MHFAPRTDKSRFNSGDRIHVTVQYGTDTPDMFQHYVESRLLIFTAVIARVVSKSHNRIFVVFFKIKKQRVQPFQSFIGERLVRRVIYRRRKRAYIATQMIQLCL